MRLNWTSRCCIALVVCVPLIPGTSNGGRSESYLRPHLVAAEMLGNVFSRTIAYKVEGFNDVVKRVSGTATYKFVPKTPEIILLQSEFEYDGRPTDHDLTEIKDGGRTICYKGACAPATDASGVLYNPLLWGEPEETLRKGSQWNVAIAQPWELGPPGQETVRVLNLDAVSHSVELQREGSGEGFFARDAKQITLERGGNTYLADLVPGKSQWIGIATFRQGRTVSDELMVERPITLTLSELGTVSGTEREYILLNSMPLAGVAKSDEPGVR